jgi:hypothetical protein
MASRVLRRFGAPLVLLLVMAAAGFAATIDISTSNNSTADGYQWIITDIGATGGQSAVAYNPGGNPFVSFTSTGQTGGTSACPSCTFNGFWVATLSFNLPSWATGVSLNYSNLMSDDRALLLLNPTGTITGSSTSIIGSTGMGTTNGSMQFTASGTQTPYTFNSLSWFGSGTVNSGFNIGGTNTLMLLVNNTNGGAAGSTVPFGSSGDTTVAGVSGTLTYSAPPSGVPEPSAIAYILIGLVPLAYKVARRRAN